jgi:hypothetical protein
MLTRIQVVSDLLLTAYKTIPNRNNHLKAVCTKEVIVRGLKKFIAVKTAIIEAAIISSTGKYFLKNI